MPLIRLFPHPGSSQRDFILGQLCYDVSYHYVMGKCLQLSSSKLSQYTGHRIMSLTTVGGVVQVNAALSEVCLVILANN